MRAVRWRAAAVAVVLAVSTAVVATVTPGSAASSAPPVAFPTSPKGLKAPVALPAQVDPTPRYVPQSACQPGTPTGVAKLRALVLATYGQGGAGNTARSCSEGVSEHADGRAWDWMVDVTKPAEKAAAADFLAWLTKDGGTNARRLGVMYVIYNEKIWASYRDADGWRASSGHRDHVHVSFSWNGARGTTSFWTGKVHPVDHGPCSAFAGQPGTISTTAQTTACPTSAALVRTSRVGILELGARGAQVSTAQRLLGVAVTGTFDGTTRTAVRAYQRDHDLPVTGTLDVPTWASIAPSTRTSDASAGFTPRTAAAHGAKGITTPLRWRDTGKAVQVLQVALGLPVADRNGHLGYVTGAAIRQAQRDLGRPETGIWVSADWKALAAT